MRAVIVTRPVVSAEYLRLHSLASGGVCSGLSNEWTPRLAVRAKRTEGAAAGTVKARPVVGRATRITAVNGIGVRQQAVR